MNVVLPSSKFGMTRTYFNVGGMPEELPRLPLINAANLLNEFRHYELTSKQRNFVSMYLAADFDAAKGALQSGLTYDPNEALAVGTKMLKNEKVQKAIELALAYLLENTKFNFDRDVYVRELHAVATGTIGDFFKNDGLGDPYLAMPEDNEKHKLKAVKSIKVKSYKEGRGPSARDVKEVEFTMYDKLAACKEMIRLCDLANGTPQPADSTTVNNTQVNIAASGAPTVRYNIIPVPSGEFIPAPPNPYLQIEATANA